MPEEIKPDETKEVIEETKEVVNDEKGEVKEEKDKVEKVEEEFDESKIDPEVRDYKPVEKVEEEEEEVDPEDKARIEKIIDKKYGGDLQQVKKQITIDSYFTNHPEDAKYKGAALKYLNHPTYSGLPIHNIVAIVSAKDRERIGAAKEREAQRIVAETKSPGSTFRKPSGGTTDWLNASKEEYEAQKAKVLGHP